MAFYTSIYQLKSLSATISEISFHLRPNFKGHILTVFDQFKITIKYIIIFIVIIIKCKYIITQNKKIS